MELERHLNREKQKVTSDLIQTHLSLKSKSAMMVFVMSCVLYLAFRLAIFEDLQINDCWSNESVPVYAWMCICRRIESKQEPSLLWVMGAVIGEFSGPYSTPRTAKLSELCCQNVSYFIAVLLTFITTKSLKLFLTLNCLFKRVNYLTTVLS